ncbi:UNVERIFIED_CONTAM: hypothetical protein K2H54_031971 [Gekko kuhli]
MECGKYESRLHGESINITITEVYISTIDADEEEIERFYASVQEETGYAPKQDGLIILGSLCLADYLLPHIMLDDLLDQHICQGLEIL